MAESEYAAKPLVEIDESEIDDEVADLLEQVVVDDDLRLPDMFVLRFHDGDGSFLRTSRIGIGSTVRVLAAALGRLPDQLLISGEVTAIEAELDGTGRHLVVRGYDHSHRLRRGTSTETYTDMKDSDIAQRLAERAGLEIGRIDDSGRARPHVSRLNLNDWDFLTQRAREIGFEVAVRDGKLDFCRPSEAATGPEPEDRASSNPLQLVLKENLEALRPRVTAADQVHEVVARGWDPSTKQPVLGRADAGTVAAEVRSSELPKNPLELAAKFGKPSYLLADCPLDTQADAEAAAKAAAERIGSAFLEADGVAEGDPMLRAGAAVSIGPAGDPFESRCTLTSTRHVFDEDGYRTHFVASGRQQRSLLGIVSNGSSASGGQGLSGRINGVVVALVTDVRDPAKLGRVKLRYPWLSDTYVSDWVRMTQAGAGKKRGAMFVPEVDDEVLVAFEFGDVSFPVVIGSLHNGVDVPPFRDDLIDATKGAIRRRGIVSKDGHTLEFVEDAKESTVRVVSGKGALRIALEDTGTVIRITSKGQIEIHADGNVTLSANGRLRLEGKQGVAIQSSGPVEVKGSRIDLN